jgi:hypothetical protein
MYCNIEHVVCSCFAGVELDFEESSPAQNMTRGESGEMHMWEVFNEDSDQNADLNVPDDEDAIPDLDEDWELVRDFEMAEEERAALEDLPASALTWKHVRELPVCEKLAPDSQCSVLQAAFSILHNMTTTGSTFDAAARHLDFINYTLLSSRPSPSNPHNRMPPSLHICQEIVGVSDISEFEVHMCPSITGCLHWWVQDESVQNPTTHMAHCAGCSKCSCPKCGLKRFELVNGKAQPKAPVYFFPDVFQQFFYDRRWYEAIMRACQDRKAPWYSSPEFKRLEAFFRLHGLESKVRRAFHIVAVMKPPFSRESLSCIVTSIMATCLTVSPSMLYHFVAQINLQFIACSSYIWLRVTLYNMLYS